MSFTAFEEAYNKTNQGYLEYDTEFILEFDL